MVIVAIAGHSLGEQAVEGEISEQISEPVHPSSAAQVEEILSNVDISQTGLFSVIGIAILLFMPQWLSGC